MKKTLTKLQEMIIKAKANKKDNLYATSTFIKIVDQVIKMVNSVEKHIEKNILCFTEEKLNNLLNYVNNKFIPYVSKKLNRAPALYMEIEKMIKLISKAAAPTRNNNKKNPQHEKAQAFKKLCELYKKAEHWAKAGIKSEGFLYHFEQLLKHLNHCRNFYGMDLITPVPSFFETELEKEFNKKMVLLEQIEQIAPIANLGTDFLVVLGSFLKLGLFKHQEPTPTPSICHILAVFQTISAQPLQITPTTPKQPQNQALNLPTSAARLTKADRITHRVNLQFFASPEISKVQQVKNWFNNFKEMQERNNEWWTLDVTKEERDRFMIWTGDQCDKSNYLGYLSIIFNTVYLTLDGYGYDVDGVSDYVEGLELELTFKEFDEIQGYLYENSTSSDDFIDFNIWKHEEQEQQNELKKDILNNIDKAYWLLDGIKQDLEIIGRYSDRDEIEELNDYLSDLEEELEDEIF